MPNFNLGLGLAHHVTISRDQSTSRSVPILSNCQKFWYNNNSILHPGEAKQLSRLDLNTHKTRLYISRASEINL